MLTFCCALSSCVDSSSPPKTDADTQSRVWRRAPLHHSSPSTHTHRFSPHDAQRGEIINSTATEAQNHIHSDCHWLLLLAFEIYDDHLIMKFLSWYFSHKSRRKPWHKARKRSERLKLRIIYRSDCAICVWPFWKGTCDTTLKGRTHFMDTACFQQTSWSCLLRSIQLTDNKKVNKNIHESRFVLKHQKLYETFVLHPERSSFAFVFSQAYSVKSSGGGAVGMWGTWTLICEVIAFLCRIANSNICHLKRTAVVTKDAISRGLSLSLFPTLSVRNNGCQV